MKELNYEDLIAQWHKDRNLIEGSTDKDQYLKLIQEAGIHQNVKEKMTEADELSTNLMFRTMHNTARVFKNSISDQVVEIESTGSATFEDVKDLVAGQRGRVVFEEGDLEHGIWSAGISVARVKDVPTCKEMVSRLVSEAEEIIDGRLQSVKA